MTPEQCYSDSLNHVIGSSNRIFHGGSESIADPLCSQWGEERKAEVHVHTRACIHIYINLPWFQGLQFENHPCFTNFLLE